MKKKIFGGIAIVAIAVAVALNVSLVNNKADKTSLLALANVEALAEAEGGIPLYSYPCKNGSGAQCIPFTGVTGPTCSVKHYC